MKIPAVALLLIAAAAALLFACKSQEEAPPLTSGIEGQVLIGPMCPVVQEGTPCPDVPYAAGVEVWNADRTELVATFETNKQDGLFRVPLPPGDYYLDPQAPKGGGPPTPIPQAVTVPPDRFAQITVQYDSGIR